MRLAYLLLVTSLNAAAQTTPERAERADVRELRRNAIVSAQEFAERARRPVDYRLLLGLAYTDAESGETRWATPFQFRARFNDRNTFVKVSGDGYVDSRLGEDEASGIANVNVALSHRLAQGLRGIVGVTVPTGGEVGSERGRERIGFSYERELSGPWSGLVEARLVRYDEDPDPGESRVRRQFLVQAAYNFASSAVAFAQLEHVYRPGVTRLSIASIGYQRQVGRTAAGPLFGVLTYSRGLTEGLHDNTIEFDLCYGF